METFLVPDRPDCGRVRDVVCGEVVVVTAPFSGFRQTRHFERTADTLINEGVITARQLGDAIWYPKRVRVDGQRYQLTCGPVTVAGLLVGDWLQLLEVVVRDAATVAARSDDD